MILFPIIRRNIYQDGKDTGFFDVISPYGYSGPFVKRGMSQRTIIQFWNMVDEWYLQNKVVTEFIRFSFNQNWIGYNGMLFPTLKTVYGQVLSETEQWINFKPKVRNNIRKAQKFGLNAKIHHNDLLQMHILYFYYFYI